MLTHRFDDAFAFAAQVHRTQTRQVSGTPYIAHLLSVCALVLEYGGDETSAIAALLHDAVKGQGGLKMADQIEVKFGADVRAIVDECNDPGGAADVTWRARKDAFAAAIAQKSTATNLVITCDTLHNATSILHNLRSDGLWVFSQLDVGRDNTLWYYHRLNDMLSRRAPYDLALRLSVVVAQLEAEVAVKLNSDD